MTLLRSAVLGTLCIASGVLLGAQDRPPHPAANNPHLRNRESIRAGMAAYRIICADCHGLDAGGYRGPDLVAFIGRRRDRRAPVRHDPQGRAGHGDARAA